MLHDLSGSVTFLSHLEMLGVFLQRHRNLLTRDIVAAALDDLSGFFWVTKLKLDSGCNEPDFPLDVVRTELDCVGEEADCLVAFVYALIGLGCFYVNFPLQLPSDVLEHLI